MGEQNEKINHEANHKSVIVPIPADAKVVNLEDYGFEESRKASGNIETLERNLNLLKRAQIVPDEKYKISEEEKKKIGKEIDNLKSKLTEIELKNKQAEEDVKSFEGSITKQKNKKKELIENPPPQNNFQYNANLIILGLLSIFLYLLYDALIYRALFTNIATMAQSLATDGGAGFGSILPSTQELINAFHESVLILFAPFIFFAFGWALHVLLEMKGKTKYIIIPLLILITFSLDAILAYLIHERTGMAKELVGMDHSNWRQSPDFYVIIGMGFVSFVIWSILLHHSLNLGAEMTDPTKKINKSIDFLEGEIEKIKKDIDLHAPDNLKKKISDLEIEIDNSKPLTNITNNIEFFSIGWFDFLNARPQMFKEQISQGSSFRNQFIKTL